jgi:hypothetical protein
MKTASTPATMTSFSFQPPNPPDNSDRGPSSLLAQIIQLFEARLQRHPGSLKPVAQRLAQEVDRVCRMSTRIQTSGQVTHWQMTLVRHRVDKCLGYYQLGSHQGRVELHSTLSSIVYRHIAPSYSNLGFKGRCELLEDFMQNFYIEVLNAFRREHQLVETYSPRTRLELAEYMAFCEQYGKRRISIQGRQPQQLIVLRAQAFSRRQPNETSVDMALVADGAKSEDAESHARSSVMQQVRDKMTAEAQDPGDAVMRDRIINALIQYLQDQNQQDCIDYLVLKLQDYPAAEIDEILGVSPRERDYLQQRFKYHVEKFAQHHEWELVHQWLGAHLDADLGMTPEEWSTFWSQLPPDLQQLTHHKRKQHDDPRYTDDEIAQALGWTPKRVSRAWGKILKLAWQFRNRSGHDPAPMA